MGDDDRLSWRELQRRALLAGIPATLPRDELEERLGIDDEDDVEEPTPVPDGGTAAATADADVDPMARLNAAREEIRAAFADLDDDDGTIRVRDDVFVSAHGDSVAVEIDGSPYEFDREFATLLGMCVYVAAAR